MCEASDECITKVEQLFRNVDRDIDDIFRKLESDSDVTDEASSHNHSSVISLAQLLTKIRQIQIDYKSVVEEIAEIEAEEKDALEFFHSSSLSITDSFSILAAEEEVKQELSSVVDEAKEFSSFFDERRESPGSADSEGSALNEEDETSFKGVVKQKGMKVVAPDKERSNVRRFVPIHESTFLRVSELVRGKVKLEDVNTTFERLWKYFKQEKNTKPLTPSDMDKMGFRVSGKTGLAKLKVLHCLKLIQMTSKGDVRGLNC